MRDPDQEDYGEEERAELRRYDEMERRYQDEGYRGDDDENQ